MKKFVRSSVTTWLLFVVAIVLLAVGTIGAAQAALTEFSKDWVATLNLSHIGVTLLENGQPVGWRNYGNAVESGWDELPDGDLIKTMIATQKEGDPAGTGELKIGTPYDFRLSVKNTGPIDEYVRVTIYRYWVDAENETIAKNGWFHGNNSSKYINTIYSPDLIDITLGDQTNWIADPANTATSERLVYYYRSVLPAGSGITTNLTSSLKISPEIRKYVKEDVTEEFGKTVKTYTYFFDNKGFVIKAEADAIQTHHWREAMNSAWGVIDNSVLSKIQAPAGQ